MTGMNETLQITVNLTHVWMEGNASEVTVTHTTPVYVHMHTMETTVKVIISRTRHYLSK